MLEVIGYVLFIYGLYLVVDGLFTLATGKVHGFGMNLYEKYTRESIKSAAPIIGIGSMIVGLGMVGFKVGSLITSLAFLNNCSWIILVCGIVVGVLGMTLGCSKFVEN